VPRAGPSRAVGHGLAVSLMSSAGALR
jgi:hypothetical protein